MKKIENVTVYKCDHCKKKLFLKHAMVKHEAICHKNPAMWDACTTCKYSEQVPKEFIYDEDSDNPGVSHRNGFRCAKLNKSLYSHAALIKDLPNKYPKTFEGEELMPNECEHYDFVI